MGVIANRSTWALVVCLAWLLGAPASAAAGSAGAVAGLRYDTVGFGSIEDGPGGFAVRTLRLRAGLGRFSLTYSHADFTWRSVDRLPLGDGVRPPWDDLHTLTLSMRGIAGTHGAWRYRLDPLIQASYEREPSGSLGLGIKGSVGWSFGRGWALVMPYDLMVVAVHNQPALVVILGLSLDFPEQSIRRMLTKWGVPPWLARAVDLRLEFSQQNQYYQLSDDSPTDPGGELWIEQTSLALLLTIEPNDKLLISLGPRALFSRRISLELPFNQENSWPVRGAWGFSFQVLYRF